LRFAFVCLAGLILAARAPAAPLVGRMDGDTYVSPTGQFRVRAPVVTDLGGTIEDTDTVVTFHDDFGTHVSIACFELDATQRWELDTRGLRDYLLYFASDIVMANFRARFPGSTIQSARYLPELRQGALIAYSLLPGGSHFENLHSVLTTPPPKTVVAKRGTLLFVHRRHVYVVSTELAERATQRDTYQLTTQQEDDLLFSRLTALAERMSFTDDEPRKP
jgi:hypothetical protein